jgi:peroxiredoxin
VSEFEGFIDEHGLTFPTISDGEAAIYERFEIPVQPALVVIDGSGEVDTINGSVDETLLDEVFAAAVQP